MRRIIGAVALLAVTAAACGGDDDPTAASTTTAEATSTSAPAPTTSSTVGDPLDVSAVQYLGLLNSQLPLIAPDATDLRLDVIADGVYGSTIDLGTTVMVFADSPASSVTAVAIVVDLDVTRGTTPARLIGGASFGLDRDDSNGVLEAFNAQVVPDLGAISSARTDYHLAGVDLIRTADAPVLTFTYVAPGSDLPPYIE